MIFEIFSASLVSKKLAKKLMSHYGGEEEWHNLDEENGDLGYGLIHYSLIRVLKPKKLLAVGSRYGFIPACMTLACRDNEFGKIDFVDPGYDQRNPDQPDHWGGMGFWKEVDFKKHFSVLNLQDYIDLFLMESQSFGEKFPDKEYGYVYLDGDHSYHGVKKDFANFWPRLKKGGLMVFHDINMKPTKKLDYGVYKLWKELNKEDYNCINFPGKMGLGIVQK